MQIFSSVAFVPCINFVDTKKTGCFFSVVLSDIVRTRSSERQSQSRKFQNQCDWLITKTQVVTTS